MTRGVAHVTCQKCSFKFVIRLGDPGGAKPPDERPVGAPIDLGEGVKTSGSAVSAAGEIGAAPKPKFVAAETSTSIRVDPGFQEEIQQAVSDDSLTTAPGTEPLAAQPTRLEDDTAPALAQTPTQEEALPAPASPPTEVPASPPTEVPASPPTEVPASPPTEVPASPPTEEAVPAQASAPPTAAELPPALAPPAPTPPAPAPAPPAPAAPQSGFESFKAVNQAVAPPPGAEVPAPLPAAPPAAARVMATHEVMHPAYQHPLIMVITPQNPDEWQMPEQPSSSQGMRALGLFITLALVVTAVLFFYILYKNNWSLDLANLGQMVDRAFGSEKHMRDVPDELRGLELDQPANPIVEQAKLADGQAVLTVQGVVRNNDTRSHRYVYVRATLRDNHGRKVTSVESPAGNVFSAEQLASMARLRLASSISPGGRDRSNARIEPGQSVAYMVVLTMVPHDYDSSKYKVEAEISQAELYEGP